jgi:sigma-54 dependent transcriptional regulator, acetoin dehydrogenase operon transcriptional activator AcoR
MNPIPDQASDGTANARPNAFAAAPNILKPATSGIPRVENRLLMIEQSRQRSASYGLSRNEWPDFSRLAQNDLKLLMEQNRVLCDFALPVMDTLYEQIENTHSVVILTDTEGLVLHARGDDDFLARAEKVAIQPGACWSERSKGTNAIGTTIAEQLPTLVHGSEHYLDANHFLTCSAAPIVDHQGRMVGVLDVTGDHRSYHQHTMALVRMSAQMIENQLFCAAFRNAITVHFHSRSELIGTMMEGLASFTADGRFLSANRTALFKLGLQLTALQSHTFSSLFGLPVSALFDRQRNGAGYLDLCMHTGVRVFARIELRLESPVFGSMPAVQQALPAPKPAAGRPAPRLRDLDTGDARIAAAIGKVRKVSGRDIPILICGETGTGKDWFAQAIHREAPHADGPFVAVNCASIPETLIESELFGYEDGAFTGARKSGSVGKIVQASGGTLFLDEIGDTPLPLQARLLRVLQERIVTPLGGTRSIPVRLSLVCATNRNLRDLIAQGGFREDLYYRLNGLTINLPPLRERSDLDTLVKNMLAAEADGARYRLSPEALRLVRQAAWPGNLRQLANLLRTAIAMADGDDEIRPEHLPDDFLEEAPAGVIAGRVAEPDNPAAAGAASLGRLDLALVRKTLVANRGNVSATARQLGVSRNTIYRRLDLQ